MQNLKYLITDKIPERELAFLKKNIVPEDGITILDAACMDWADVVPECSILLSSDSSLLSRMKGSGMTLLAFSGENSGSDFLAADLLMEGLFDADAEFFVRAYQRSHQIPWTILETERCIVREITLDDLDDLFALYAGEGMTAYIEPLFPYEQEKEYQRAYIDYMYKFYGYGMWVVIEKKTGTLIGRAGLEHREDMGEEPELGYAIGTPYQRNGYAFEVCSAILDYAKTHLEYDTVSCYIRTGNTASEHLARKLGFHLCGEVRIEQQTMKQYQYRIRRE